MLHRTLTVFVLLTAPAIATSATTSWSGCYGGVSGGYAFNGRSNKSNTVNVREMTFAAQPNDTRLHGGLGGAELGCNIQVANIVFGPELDAWYQDLHGTSDADNQISPGETIRSIAKSSYAGTASVRVGVGFGRFLLYGKGGLAMTTFRHSGYIFDNASGAKVDLTTNGSKATLGYAAGGGGEVALSRHMSAKLEYSYLYFGSESVPYGVNLDYSLPTANTLPGTSIAREREQLVKVGLNYRF